MLNSDASTHTKKHSKDISFTDRQADTWYKDVTKATLQATIANAESKSSSDSNSEEDVIKLEHLNQ